MLESSTPIMCSGATHRGLRFEYLNDCGEAIYVGVYAKRAGHKLSMTVTASPGHLPRLRLAVSLTIARKGRCKSPYSFTNLRCVRAAITQDKPLLLLFPQVVRR